MVSMEMKLSEETTEAGSPIIETPTHIYFILPVDQWPMAAKFVADNYDPEAPFPNDPDKSSVLAAINRESMLIEGVLCVMMRPIVDHFTVKRHAGVSYSAFHELVRAAFPVGTVYYTAVADSVGGRVAAERAGLTPHGSLAVTIVGEGAEGEDGLDRTSSIGDHRLPRISSGR
jgi:hypothetical protein